MDDEQRKSAVNAAWVLVVQSRVAANAQSRLARRWSRVQLWLGLPAAVLAAVAGAAALSDLVGNTVAGVLALTSAALGASVVFLSPAEKSVRAALASNEYRAIGADADALIYHGIPHVAELGEVDAQLKALRAHKTQVNKTADHPPRGIWHRAEQDTRDSDRNYYNGFSDSLLPAELTQALKRPNGRPA